MNYNDGRVHLDFYDDKDNWDKIADDFSEGDLLLKKALLGLWENGIKTSACCSGHDESNPYLSLIFDTNSNYLVQAICKYMYNQDGKMKILFFNHENNYDICHIDMGTQQDKNKFLNFLNSCLHCLNKYKFLLYTYDVDDINRYASLLLDIARRNNLSCKYSIDKEEMILLFSPYNVVITLDNNLNIPYLADFVENMKQPSFPSYCPLICDKQSLEQFINFFIPNLFDVKNNIVK